MVLSTFHADPAVMVAVSAAVRCGHICVASGNRAATGDALSCDFHGEHALEALELAWANCGCGEHDDPGADVSGRAAWQAAQGGQPGRLANFLQKRLTSRFYEPVGGGEAPLTQHPSRYLTKSAVGRRVARDAVDVALLIAFYCGCINGRFPVGVVTAGTVGYENERAVSVVDGLDVAVDDNARVAVTMPVTDMTSVPALGDTVTVDIADQVRDAACQTASARSRRNAARSQAPERAADVDLVAALQTITASEVLARLSRSLATLKVAAPRRFEGLTDLRHRTDGAGRPVAILSSAEDTFLHRVATRVSRTADGDRAAALRQVERAVGTAVGRWQAAQIDPTVRSDLFAALAPRLAEMVRQTSVTQDFQREERR